ncbi:hypothetical protein, partial [Marinobacter sp.]|uniref:hypothetical protein n=1 Tax=Marinobacter sp. TaxID=50741 RepID=UPI00258FC45F
MSWGTVLLYGVLKVKRFQLRDVGFGIEVTAFHHLREFITAFFFRDGSGGIGGQAFVKLLLVSAGVATVIACA